MPISYLDAIRELAKERGQEPKPVESPVPSVVESTPTSYLSEIRELELEKGRAPAGTRQPDAGPLNGVGTPPQSPAEVLSLAEKTGLPAGLIEGNIDEIKTDESRKVANEYAKNNKAVSAAMGLSPYHSALITDDFDNIGRTEKILTDLDTLSKMTIRSTASGVARFGASLHGIDEFVWSAIPGTFADKMQSYAKGYRVKAGEVAGDIQGDISELGTTARAVAGGFQSIGFQAPAIVISALTGGGAAVALGAMGVGATGQAFSEGIDAGLTPIQNLPYGLTQGGIEVATEMLPAIRLFKDIAKKTPLFKMIANQLMTEIPSEQAATLLQDAHNWAILNPDKTLSEFMQERPGRAYETLVATVVASAGMGSIGHLAGRLSEEKAPATQKDMLIALGALTGASKVKQQSPETYDEIMAEITRDSPFKDIYVAKATWDAYWEEQGEDGKVILDKLGAQEVGDDISIPITRYASEIANTPHGEVLSDDVRTTAEGKSIKQVRELRKELDKADEQEVSPEDQVRNAVKEQLIQAGVSEEDATVQAEVLYGNPFRALADRMGMDPVQMFEDLDLSIKAQGRTEEDGQTYEQRQIVTDTPVFKEWFGDSKVVDKAGTPKIVYHGTDVDFKAFDPEFTIGGQFWFTDNKGAVERREVGAAGAGVVKEVYLSLKNPAGWDVYNKLTLDEVIGRGFDGFALPDTDGTTYVAFSPTQIKSVFAQKFDPASPLILEQATRQAPTFYSELQRVVETPKFPDKAPGATMLSKLKSSSAKASELKWSGVEDFLKGKKSVTKDEVLEFLRQNAIQLEETEKGVQSVTVRANELLQTEIDDIYKEELELGSNVSRAEIENQVLHSRYDEFTDQAVNELGDIGDTKHSKYQLPGGEDYKELLLRLPDRVDYRAQYEARLQEIAETHGRADKPSGYEGYATPEEIAEMERLATLSEDSPEFFYKSHFDEPNIVAHTRFNTRTDSEGNKVLFLEEIQSDWEAEGRKRGFKEEAPEELEGKIKKAKKQYNDYKQGLINTYGIKDRTQNELVNLKDSSTTEEFDQLIEYKNALESVEREKMAFGQGVPAAPLLEDWYQLALKRMVRYAAENGFDKLAWITGEQTADRYDLSKKINTVTAQPTSKDDWRIEIVTKDNRIETLFIKEKDLASNVGKDLAEKIISNKGATGEPGQIYSGLDLKIGGEWAYALYDKTIPNYLKKFGKKFGAKVGTVDMTNVFTAEHDVPTSQQAIDITPEMKESVLTKGQTLFQAAWHGTPHKFDKFTLEHIGSGEGVQAFGWGLYFAENRGVAQFYKEQLGITPEEAEKRTINEIAKNEVASFDDDVSKAIESFKDMLGKDWADKKRIRRAVKVLETGKPLKVKFSGSLIKVELTPEFDDYLDWDKPLSKLGKKVQRDFDQAAEKANDWSFHPEMLAPTDTGEDLYKWIVELKGSPREASLYLKSIGIPGIKYLEGAARKKGEGNYNFVVFDAELIEIEEFFQPDKGREARGRITFHQKGIDIELLKGADSSTFIHETGHFYLKVMQQLAEKEGAPKDIVDDWGKILDWLGAEKGKPLTEDQHEQWARGFEAYLYEGKAPNAALAKAFKQFQEWLMDVYMSLRELNVELTDDVRDVMGRMLVVKDLEASQKKFKKSEKDVMSERRQSLKVIKDYLGLSDGMMKKLTQRRNVGNMTNYEWKKFKDDLLIRAEQLQETAFAKARLMEIFNRKRLKKVDNYRKTLGLPPVSQMTKEELDEYANALEPFEDDDIFLGPAQLSMIDFGDLEGIKTWREAKERLAKEAGVPVEVLDNIDVGQADKLRWDSVLRERNPFYRILVDQVTTALLAHEGRAHEVETEIYDLARKSEKSRGGTAWQKIVRGAVPQDAQIFEYLEASDKLKVELAKHMTPEQVDLASYMQAKFSTYLDYLIKVKSLEKGRQNYFVHLRKSFLETAKDDGLWQAVLKLFKNYEEDEMNFQILSDRTGQILPLNKHFQYAMRRKGGLDPTQNVVRAFMIYVQTIEKKMALDSIMTKMDIYAQSIAPTETTANGLEMDHKLKDFVYQYINNKKGRRFDFGGAIPQGQKIDLAIRALRTMTSVMDLGLNLATGVAALVGESYANFAMLGAKKYALGAKRLKTKKGKAITKRYEVFVGRSTWQEFWAPGKELPGKLMEGLFFMFHVSTVLHNKQFLIGSITKEEYDSGTITDERLAELRLQMGRMRVIPGAKSIIGSTSLGGAGTQYKSWAIGIARTILKDTQITASNLRKKGFKEAVTAKEGQELFRIAYLTAITLIILSFGDEEDDNSFIGQLIKKIRRESLTLTASLNPSLMMSVPRSMVFIQQLGKNLEDLVTLEEYKTKPGYKGLGGLKRQFTPATVRNLLKEN